MRKLNLKIKEENDSGFSAVASGRFTNKDGRYNVKKKGINIFDKYSWYHTFLLLPRFKFIGVLVIAYIIANLVFASIYYAIGIEHLTGIDKSSPIQEFIDVFFFSAQTFTTVGYGRIAPVGALASFVATFEAFLGLLGFAIATGLFYGRFSRPRAFLKFSDIAVIAPFEDGKALMFRVAPFKNNLLSEAEVTISAAIEELVEGKLESKFYLLEPKLKKINTFSLNWTIVHKIDSNSPFYEYTEEDFKNADIELIIMIKAFDEVFANTVVQRTSYISPEIIFGAKFLPMYHSSEDQKTTILDLDKINFHQKVSIDN